MPDPRSNHRLVLTTAGSDEQAEALARGLVERRLAACVNIVDGVCSVFRWKGEVTREAEKLLMIKTSAELVDEVGATVRELHSYETPELISLVIDGGDPDYLGWLAGSLRAPRD